MPMLDADLRVVMIIIDAMPHRYVDPIRTPRLWEQVTTGGRAPGGGTSLPMSVTYANHAAFVTGADPTTTGVYGNHTWNDREGWISAPKAGPQATTLFDLVADAGGRSVIVVGDHKLIAQMGGARADHHWPLHGWIPDGTPRCEFGYPTDAAVVAATGEINLDADLVLLHLNQPDTTSHLYGPDSQQALARYTSTDAAYGELIDMLGDRWDQTVVITLSDHDQEPVDDRTPVPLVEALAAFQNLTVATEGTGALIHGPVDQNILDSLHAIDGVGGSEQLSDDVWMAWTQPGRAFDDPPIPILGQHGSPRCRTQMAIVSGGHPRAAALARHVERHRPTTLDWAPIVSELLEINDR